MRPQIPTGQEAEVRLPHSAAWLIDMATLVYPSTRCLGPQSSAWLGS
jgi:hypothetical protein